MEYSRTVQICVSYWQRHIQRIWLLQHLLCCHFSPVCGRLAITYEPVTTGHTQIEREGSQGYEGRFAHDYATGS